MRLNAKPEQESVATVKSRSRGRFDQGETSRGYSIQQTAQLLSEAASAESHMNQIHSTDLSKRHGHPQQHALVAREGEIEHHVGARVDAQREQVVLQGNAATYSDTEIACRNKARGAQNRKRQERQRHQNRKPKHTRWRFQARSHSGRGSLSIVRREPTSSTTCSQRSPVHGNGHTQRKVCASTVALCAHLFVAQDARRSKQRTHECRKRRQDGCKMQSGGAEIAWC